MGRILAIDYGRKRTGIAVTDPLQIIATALDVVESQQLFKWLETYFQKETVDEIVLGLPTNLKSEDNEMTPLVRALAERLREKFPTKKLHLVDERFTSSMAQKVLIANGTKKKDRQVKGNTDKVAATIILQDFLHFRK